MAAHRGESESETETATEAESDRQRADVVIYEDGDIRVTDTGEGDSTFTDVETAEWEFHDSYIILLTVYTKVTHMMRDFLF